MKYMAGRFALPEGYQSLQLPISCHNRDEKAIKCSLIWEEFFPNQRLKWTQPLVAGGFACNNGWNVVSFSVENGGNDMEKITSFTIDHIKLQPGLYVSRKDKVGAKTVTTFDLRLTKPNDEPVMNTAEVHTIEHLAATYLRNEPTWKDKVLYFGPMGCRTGFYLLLTGDYTSKDVVPLVLDCFRFIRDYRGEVPGASPKDCGNYLDMNLSMANYWGRKYAALLENIDDNRLVYPE
jgi:S-ribosylhomocysteine lyase